MAASDERFVGVPGPTNFTPATVDHGNAGAGEEKVLTDRLSYPARVTGMFQ
jgi:hypothetical protein